LNKVKTILADRQRRRASAMHPLSSVPLDAEDVLALRVAGLTHAVASPAEQRSAAERAVDAALVPSTLPDALADSLEGLLREQELHLLARRWEERGKARGVMWEEAARELRRVLKQDAPFGAGLPHASSHGP
jgi:hypothetical protein